ncbi:multinuclear nonheme iron-dependent oxidase [Actinokineospora sp. NPDC004072]
MALTELPRLGSGVGYRETWDTWLRCGTAAAEWVEVIVEGCADLPERDRERMRELAGIVPVVPHGVESAFDVPGDDDPDAVAAAADLVADLAAPWFSGHLYPEALPARELGARAQRIQDRLGVPFLLEVTGCTVPEHVTAVLARCDCGLVLNLAVLCQADDPFDFLHRLPLDRVVEVHLTTGDPRAGLVELHAEPVAAPVWDVFAEVAATAPLRASVVERDGTEPHDLAEMVGDVERARALFDAQTARA